MPPFRPSRATLPLLAAALAPFTSSSSSSTSACSPSSPPYPSSAPLNPLRRLWVNATNADSRHFSRHLPSCGSGCLSYPSLTVGLSRRSFDEGRLRSLAAKASAASDENDRDRMAVIAHEMASIAYGRGVTPQARQVHLERFGCVEWSEEALSAVVKAGEKRGVVEMGAGNGQWSRALRSRGCDVYSFDDMSALPLSLSLYHKRTKPNADHFDQELRKADESLFTDEEAYPGAAHVLRGRALLLVFPDPGPMALRTLEAWKSMGPSCDTFVYVGEGRGGCNADAALFDELEGDEWELGEVVPLKSFGGKGFEKLFVWKRRTKSEQQ